MSIALGFLVGLAAVVAGAEALVRGASRAAAALGVAPLVIGLTVVAYGTSAPELAVSVSASLSGRADLAVANVVGSNVFNVLAILGTCALVAPVAVRARVVRREIPVMVLVTAGFVLLASDGALTRLEGVLLLLVLVVTTGRALRSERGSDAPPSAGAPEVARPPRTTMAVDALLVLVGLALLVLGSRSLVGAAMATAEALGVSELVVGLTIVAAGTSLPELATSLVAMVRGERDIAIGNVVGSNVFNLAGIAGFSAAISPTGLQVVEQVVALDAWVMLGAAAIVLPMALTGAAVVRWEGAALLGSYVAYTAVLVAIATGAMPLPARSVVLLVVALPVLTLGAVAWRRHGRAAPRAG